MECKNQMDSEHQIEMCLKETDKVEPAGLGFGLGKSDRSPVPQGSQQSTDSLRKIYLTIQQVLVNLFLAIQHQISED